MDAWLGRLGQGASTTVLQFVIGASAVALFFVAIFCTCKSRSSFTPSDSNPAAPIKVHVRSASKKAARLAAEADAHEDKQAAKRNQTRQKVAIAKDHGGSVHRRFGLASPSRHRTALGARPLTLSTHVSCRVRVA